MSFFDVFHSLTEVSTDPKAHNLFKDCTRAPYSPPLHPGWRAIIAKTAASLGDALSSGGVQFEPICPTPTGGFALPSLEEGRDAIWCLFELMFCFELIMLNNHFRDTSDLPDADEETAAQED